MGLSQKSLTQINKNIFVKGSDEFIERLEVKTGEGPFLKIQSDNITVCSGTAPTECFLSTLENLGVKF